MANSTTPTSNIPEWFLQTVRVMQDTDRGMRSIETQLRHAMRLEGLDPGLREDLQYVRDSLGAVLISLALMDLNAEKLLQEIIGDSTIELTRVTAEY